MSSNDIECKGCISYGKESYELVYCNLKRKFKNLECPCFTCLVKMVCIDDIYCEILSDYIEILKIKKECIQK